MYANFSVPEHANFLGAKVIAHATAFLDGRNDAADLGRNARSVNLELIPVGDDPKAKPLLDAARLLVIAMMGASAAADEVRQDRWMQVMGSLVELVRHESLELRTPDQRRHPGGTLSIDTSEEGVGI